jgi:acyl-coenzyme A thioesterase PaaI-like protein
VSTIRPARVADPLRVRGEVVRLARSVAYLEAKIRNERGDLVSQAAGTFIVRRREP